MLLQCIPKRKLLVGFDIFDTAFKWFDFKSEMASEEQCCLKEPPSSIELLFPSIENFWPSRESYMGSLKQFLIGMPNTRNPFIVDLRVTQNKRH